MRKFLLSLTIFVFAVSLSFADNLQKIYPINSEVYEAITHLYIVSGYSLPSSAGPWSEEELLKMVNKIDKTKLKGSGIDLYEWVIAQLNKTDKTFQFGLDVALEGYYHSNTEDFLKERDWIRGYDERKPIFSVNLETWPSKHFYGYFPLSFKATKYTDFDTTTGESSIFFGPQAFTTNLFFLHNPDGILAGIQELDFGFPYRAFGAVGGDGWSVQVGRDKLNWGPGVTGNFMLDGHLKYHNVGRLTTYGKNFKYTLVTSFFPHPAQYYPIMNGADFDYDYSQSQQMSGLNMFLGHRLEWRMFANKVGLAVSESIMYQSLDNTSDLRILNPAGFFHNYYIRSNSNSLITLEIDYTPISGLNLYGQLAVDEFALPGEPVPGKDSSALPSAFGYMLGAKGAYPLKKGILYGSLEGALTDPFLYLRYGDSGSQSQNPGDYGINYIVAIREYYSGGHIVYDEDFIGYKYGPDAIVFNLNGGYKEFDKWSVEGNLFFMLHGTHDKGTLWSEVNNLDTPSGSTIPYESTPTDTHHTGNNYDLHPDYRNSVSQTFVFGVKGNYTIIKNLNAYAQADLVHIINPGNIKTNPPITDVQLTVGVSYSL